MILIFEAIGGVDRGPAGCNGDSRHAVRRCASVGEPAGADRHPLRQCPRILKVTQAARADWLAQNRELAARYCATTLRAPRELFALIEKHPFWTEDGGLSDDSVRFMIDIATALR
jgi:hypothetical protein